MTEIYHMLVLSTAHLTKYTCNTYLDGLAFPKADYGWFVYVFDDDPEDLPPELAACLDFARLSRCQWIMFDRDGPTVPELEVFEW